MEVVTPKKKKKKCVDWIHRVQDISTAQYSLKRRLGGPHRRSGYCSEEEK
jgi:hypothetical protein